MGDPSDPDRDMRTLCARALRDYEEAIAAVIRPPPTAPVAEAPPPVPPPSVEGRPAPPA